MKRLAAGGTNMSAQLRTGHLLRTNNWSTHETHEF